jgi:predicted SAM-dependent methyltransferase
MKKKRYLNLGCGKKFHKEWKNLDMVSNSEFVEQANLLQGIPYPNNFFDVVYHSQVLEHFSKQEAPSFLNECFRVLKPGGICRIVVPDLENIARTYLDILAENLRDPNKVAEANYDWILLEMYDQTARNSSGGMMSEFIGQPELINKNFVFNRMGRIAKLIRGNYKEGLRRHVLSQNFFQRFIKYIKFIKSKFKSFFESKEKQIGKFRLSGEVHMWMYDKFSLSRLLKQAGFKDIEVKSPFESQIPEWDKYELDVKDGTPFDPTSLFIEAKKL